MLPLILFPCDEMRPSRVDTGFNAEWTAAQDSGFKSALLDHSAIQRGDAVAATRPLRTQAPAGEWLYRGWMIHADRYPELCGTLEQRGLRPFTEPADYRETHWLPRSLDLLRDATPETAYVVGPGPYGDQVLLELIGELAPGPAVVKDFVKSQKYYWDEACYIPELSDTAASLRVIRRFLELQPEPEGGLVLRRFEQFQGARDSGGRPVAAEWRVWWLDGRPLAQSANHDVTAPATPGPPDEFVEQIGSRFHSRFFTLDVAQRTDGAWRVIEVGDGQVSGLPPSLSPDVFYSRLAGRLSDGVEG